MFSKFGVFNRTELESRVEIKYENYAKVINVEARTMIDMASKQIIPAVIKYTKALADTVIAVKSAGIDAPVQTELLAECNGLLADTKAALAKLMEVTEIAASMQEGRDQAVYYHEEVMKAMKELRLPVDRLEMIVDKEMWPMPSYGDLLFGI